MRNFEHTNAKTDKHMSKVLLTRDRIEPRTICMEKSKNNTFMTMPSQPKQH